MPQESFRLRPRWVLDALSLLTPFDTPSLAKRRIGAETDGGYVMFDDFDNSGPVYSFGIGDMISFDRHLADMGKQVFMFDHTIESLPFEHGNFHFFREGLGPADQPEAALFTLAHQLGRHRHDGRDDMVLKIDVEGAEIDALLATPPDTLRQFRQFVLEVHWLAQLADPAFAGRFIAVFEKINSLFTLCHVHANNCAQIVLVEGYPAAEVLELTYVRSDLIVRRPSRTIYPTLLDFSNGPASLDHLLWFYPFLPLGEPADGLAPIAAMHRSCDAADQSVRAHRAAELKHRLAILDAEAEQLRSELGNLG
jgi:hypothetical protein